MLNIVNFILLLVVIGYLIKRDVLIYFEFHWNETFWLNRKYGFVVMKWVYPLNSIGNNAGKPILQWNWRDPENIPDSLELKRQIERESNARP